MLIGVCIAHIFCWGLGCYGIDYYIYQAGTASWNGNTLSNPSSGIELSLNDRFRLGPNRPCERCGVVDLSVCSTIDSDLCISVSDAIPTSERAARGWFYIPPVRGGFLPGLPESNWAWCWKPAIGWRHDNTNGGAFSQVMWWMRLAEVRLFNTGIIALNLSAAASSDNYIYPMQS